MKTELIKILNEELLTANKGIEKATYNVDLTSKLGWIKYKNLIEKLIKRIQDQA